MERLARQLHHHCWLSALLLGCLVLRAFVPAGYMVGTDAHGALQLKLCSGLTLAAPTDPGTPGDAGSAPPSDGQEHQGACPFSAPLFAVAFALSLSLEAPAALPPLPDTTPSVLPAVTVSPSRLPRGPPVLPA